MTRTLILVRHAKSAWPADTRDVARPLAGRGRRDAPAVGRWLREQGRTIDLVVCSPAVRAAQTWDLVAAQLADMHQVRHDERLYGASAEELLRVTLELPNKASTVVLVGHNPGLEDFLELLTGTVEVLKTSTVAVMIAPGKWGEAHSRSWSLETMVTLRGT